MSLLKPQSEKSQVLALFVASATLLPGVGAAQDVNPSVSSTAGSEDPASIEEVIVTAQRRAERVQDVPLAVSVVSSEVLEKSNIVDVSGLTTLIPSVTFQAGNVGNNPSFRIRGIGTDVFSVGVEPSVSTVIDGVVVARPGAAFGDLVDIERVEVLRGPQGTLFGKNSSAGVINIVTKNPNFDRFEATTSITSAEDSEFRIRASVSGPISENLAGRLAVFSRKLDGNVFNRYDNDTVNDVRTYGAQGKLQWRPSDGASFILAADASNTDSTCCAAPIRINAVNPIQLATGTPIGVNNDQVNNDVNTFVNSRARGASLTADIDLSNGFTSTSIVAYRLWDNDGNPRDLDNTAAQQALSNRNIQSSEAKSAETRIISPSGGPFDFVAGLFFYDHNIDSVNFNRGYRRADVQSRGRINPDGTITIPVSFLKDAVNDSSVGSKNYSAYTQFNFRPADGYTLIAGGRYIREEQDWFFNRTGITLANRTALGPINESFKDDAFIWKLGAQYEFSRDVMVYASYGTGYKGQGINAALNLTEAEAARQPLKPEESDLLEIGIKSQLFNRALTLNVTGFDQTLKQYQAQALDPILGGSTLTNAGSAKFKGIELELSARPMEGLSLSGGITYLDAYFSNFTGATCFGGQTVAQGCVGGIQDVTGGAFPNAPKWRGTLSIGYETPIFSDGPLLFVNYDFRSQSEVQFDITQDPNTMQQSYSISDLAIGVKSLERGVSAEFFVKNLFDKRYISAVETWPVVHAGAGGYLHLLPRDFYRYFGVRVSAKL